VRTQTRVFFFFLFHALALQTVLLWHAFLISLIPALFLQRLDVDGIVEASMGANSDAFFFHDTHTSLCRDSMKKKDSFLVLLSHAFSSCISLEHRNSPVVPTPVVNAN